MNEIITKVSKLLRNTLVVILSFFMCANVLYTDVFAYDDDFQDDYVLNKIEDNDIDYDDIAYELIDKREGNKRYFKMNDGTTISCVYDHTVAIQDDNGDYQLIDNRLTTFSNDNSINFLSSDNDDIHSTPVVLSLSNVSVNIQAQVEIIYRFVSNYILYLNCNFASNLLVEINPKLLQPDTFLDAFCSEYGKDLVMQDIIGAEIVLITNSTSYIIRKYRNKTSFKTCLAFND